MNIPKKVGSNPKLQSFVRTLNYKYKKLGNNPRTILSNKKVGPHEKIKFLRLIFNMSQKELGDSMNVTQSFISKVEKNEMTFSYDCFFCFSKAFSIKPEVLITYFTLN